eukprot:3095122-Amphidinium_carterae.5
MSYQAPVSNEASNNDLETSHEHHQLPYHEHKGETSDFSPTQHWAGSTSQASALEYKSEGPRSRTNHVQDLGAAR